MRRPLCRVLSAIGVRLPRVGGANRGGAPGTAREGRTDARGRLARGDTPGRHRQPRRLASGSNNRRPRRVGARRAGPASADRGARRAGAGRADPSPARHPVPRLHAHRQPRALRTPAVRSPRPPARARDGGVRGGSRAVPRRDRGHGVGDRRGVVLDRAGAPGRAEGPRRAPRHLRAHRRPVLGADRAFVRVDLVPAGRSAGQGVAARPAAAHARDRAPRARAVRGARRLLVDGFRAAREPAEQLEPVDQFERAGRDAPRRA